MMNFSRDVASLIIERVHNYIKSAHIKLKYKYSMCYLYEDWQIFGIILIVQHFYTKFVSTTYFITSSDLSYKSLRWTTYLYMGQSKQLNSEN